MFNKCAVYYFKVPLLLETINELETDVCILTETWLRRNDATDRIIEDFQNQNQLAFIRVHETEAENKKFGSWLAHQDWRPVLRATDVDSKVGALHELFQEATSHSYEWKTRKKKTSEPVWMTDGIRDLIKRRRKLFKKLRRRGSWLSLKNKISAVVELSLIHI